MSLGTVFNCDILYDKIDGKNNIEEGRSTSSLFVFVYILGVLLFALIFFSKPLISLMGQRCRISQTIFDIRVAFN
jgi:MATE family multidrug resistance protein